MNFKERIENMVLLQPTGELMTSTDHCYCNEQNSFYFASIYAMFFFQIKPISIDCYMITLYLYDNNWSCQ